MSAAIARARLAHQLLAAKRATTPTDVVETLGALQAQDYGSVLWSIGVRTTSATIADVERAFQERGLVRSWPLRGTLHVVPAVDLGWMLSLTGARTIASLAGRHRQLALDADAFARAEKALVRALVTDKELTRERAFEVFARANVSSEGQRGYHLLVSLALRGVICFGPHQGKTPSFVLLDAWVPKPRRLAKDEALATLAERYVTGRAPVTVQDFAWWSGLPLTLVKPAFAAAEQTLKKARVQAAPAVHLLPGFDEYLLGYKDRSAVLRAEHASKIVPGGNGIFQPTLLRDGQVIGTWKRKLSKRGAVLSLLPFEALHAKHRAALAEAAQCYGRFLSLPVTVD